MVLVQIGSKLVFMATESPHRLIMGKWCLHASSFIFDGIIIKIAGNQDRHKSLDKFRFRASGFHGPFICFLNERISSLACG